MTYPFWSCACPHPDCSDETMKNYQDKASPTALLLHLKQDHVPCTGPKEDIWICPSTDCTWEHKFTAGWEEKDYYDQVAEFVGILAHLGVDRHQKILWMKSKGEVECFQGTMREWEGLAERPRRNSGQIARGRDRTDQGFRGLKRRKDGRDGYPDVPKFE